MSQMSYCCVREGSMAALSPHAFLTAIQLLSAAKHASMSDVSPFIITLASLQAAASFMSSRLPWQSLTKNDRTPLQVTRTVRAHRGQNLNSVCITINVARTFSVQTAKWSNITRKVHYQDLIAWKNPAFQVRSNGNLYIDGGYTPLFDLITEKPNYCTVDQKKKKDKKHMSNRTNFFLNQPEITLLNETIQVGN